MGSTIATNLDPPWELYNQPRPHPCLCVPTKPAPGPMPAMGAPVICSGVPQPLCIQSCLLQHKYPEVTQPLRHSSNFSPSRGGGGDPLALAHSQGSQRWSHACCEHAENAVAGSRPSLCTCVGNWASVADLGSFLCRLLVAVWTMLQHLRAVSLQPTPVLAPGLSAEAQVSAPSLPHTPATHI